MLGIGGFQLSNRAFLFIQVRPQAIPGGLNPAVLVRLVNEDD